MKDVVIKPSNPAYKEFFKEDGTLLFTQAIYSVRSLFFSSKGNFDSEGGGLCYIDVSHKDFVYSAMYEASIEGKNILLKFVRLTGESN
jgi:hypothetical protein